MDPDADDFHPSNSFNLACAVVDLRTKELKPLIPYGATGLPRIMDDEQPLYDTLKYGGGCTGKLLVVGTRLPGKIPTVRQPDNMKLHGTGGSAFVVAVPENGDYPGIEAKVAALLLSARHVCTKNRTFNQYDPTAFYFTPEPVASFDTFDVNRPERYSMGRLYKCEIVKYVIDKPTTSSLNLSSHEIIGDAVVLAALLPAVNEEFLKSIVHSDGSTLDVTCLRIGKQVLIPSVKTFYPGAKNFSKTDHTLAAIGYPSGFQLCVPQENATDFNAQLPVNILRPDRLAAYYNRGLDTCVASLGGIAGPRDYRTVCDNNGFAATASTNGGMSGGPVLDLSAVGLFNGITIGSATIHPRLHLVDALFNVLEQDPYDVHAARAVIASMGSQRVRLNGAQNLDFAINPYQRREIVLKVCDNAVTALKQDAEENLASPTFASLNFNHTISVAGSTISALYADCIFNHIDRERLEPAQQAAWDQYVNNLDY